MNRLSVVLCGLLLTGTANLAAAATATTLISVAQATLNTKNQGRACTLVERSDSFLQGSSKTVAYAKALYLTSRGLATRTASKAYGLTYDHFEYRTSIKENQSSGVFIQDANGLLYCYGRWTVTAAKLTTGFQAEAGRQAVEATAVLSSAPAWIKSDPKAAILAKFNSKYDQSELITLNAYDKGVPASFTGPNRIWIPIPAPGR